MLNLKTIAIYAISTCLLSCGLSYHFIGEGESESKDLKFNIKEVNDCCGCAGIVVNTFKERQLQSQLFVETSEGCPYLWTKFNFSYTAGNQKPTVDTLVAVNDSTWKYPVTEIDRLAFLKIDSFIANQTSHLYRINKISITGYREKLNGDKSKIMHLPRLDKRALKQ